MKYLIAALPVLFIFTVFMPAQDVDVTGSGYRTYLDGIWSVQYGDAVEEDSWEDIVFPDLKFAFPDDSNLIWFMRTFSVDASIQDEPLGLFLGKLPDSSEIYLNGSLLLRSGRQAPEEYFPETFTAFSTILPSGLIKYDESNVLLLKVYSERHTGALPSMFISTPGDAKTKTIKINTLNSYLGLATTVITLLTALYFGVMFVMDRKTIGYLYMVIGSLGFSVNSGILYITGSPFSYLTMFKIYIIALYWGIAGIQLFVMYLGEFDLKLRSRIFILAVTAAISIAAVLIPDLRSTLFYNDNVIYLIWVIPMLMMLLYVTIRGIREKVKFMYFILGGAIVAILSGGRDILLLQLNIAPDFYSNLIGLTALIVSVFITYAAQFNYNERLLRIQAHKLAQMTENLEGLVKERTKELENAYQELSHQAVTDMLTGTFNRLEYSRVLESENAQFKRTGQNYAVIYIDLDNFKYINDTYGHASGDFVLLEISKLLKDCKRSSDFLFRMGGDEFLILMTNTSSGKDAINLVDRIYQQIEKKEYLRPALSKFTGEEIVYPEDKKLSLTIGISSTDISNVTSLHDLLFQADMALLDAKVSGKNRYAFYEKSL